MSFFPPGKKSTAVLLLLAALDTCVYLCLSLSLSPSADDPKQSIRYTYLEKHASITLTSCILHPASYNLYTSYKNNPRVKFNIPYIPLLIN